MRAANARVTAKACIFSRRPSGAKYWHLKYRVDGKERVHVIGIYPTVSLLAARKARDAIKDQIRGGLDPSQEKRRVQLEAGLRRTNSFEATAREWHESKCQTWKSSYADGVIALIEKELFPALGARPIAEITPPELLAVLRKIEARGALEMSKKSMQLAGQVFRFGVATGRCERDPTPDLKGALKTRKAKNMASISEVEAARADAQDRNVRRRVPDAPGAAVHGADVRAHRRNTVRRMV